MNGYTSKAALAATAIGVVMTIGACSSWRDSNRQDTSANRTPTSVSESAPARTPPASVPTQGDRTASAASGRQETRPATRESAPVTTAGASPSTQRAGPEARATGGMGTSEPRPRQSRG